jgi:hypothetical protein
MIGSSLRGSTGFCDQICSRQVCHFLPAFLLRECFVPGFAELKCETCEDRRCFNEVTAGSDRETFDPGLIFCETLFVV